MLHLYIVCQSTGKGAGRRDKMFKSRLSLKYVHTLETGHLHL